MKTIRGFDLRFDSVMSAALALNQTLQSWNYSDEMQLGNSSFKAELMRNILKLDFIGLSGRVVFDSNGDRTSVVMIYQLRTRNPTVHTGWLTAGGSPPVDAPELLTRQLQLSRSGAIAITSASSIGIAVSIATVAVNFHYRELRLIKMSSPLVNNVIGAGCLMCYASCIVMAVNSHWAVSTGLCWTQTALLTIGYSAAFGAMLAKTWRVHRIFTNVKLRRVVSLAAGLLVGLFMFQSHSVAKRPLWRRGIT
uniref:G_PROTEIN_RECEP_F3_4 domain-containing protein n=1 Tax=Macrostomum lignano TaxID=282301 RepID=A0A1I8HN94_9PLAT